LGELAADQAVVAVPVEELEESPPSIVRTKQFAVKPIDTEEAIEQMELLGHSFFVFLNQESGRTNVIYRRSDGQIGLIDPVLG
jgi:putative sigma-54 modulation protein